MFIKISKNNRKHPILIVGGEEMEKVKEYTYRGIENNAYTAKIKVTNTNFMKMKYD